MKSANSLNVSGVVLLSSFIALIACKKNDNQVGNQSNNPPPPLNSPLAPYSGTWVGTINVDDLALCTYTGDPITVSQTWIVNPDSTVRINELLLDFNNPTAWSQIWNGKLYNRDSLFVTMVRNINCFGTSQPMTTLFKSKIVKETDNKYTLMVKVNYPMCPPDCLFSFNYLVKKQG